MLFQFHIQQRNIWFIKPERECDNTAFITPNCPLIKQSERHPHAGGPHEPDTENPLKLNKKTTTTCWTAHYILPPKQKQWAELVRDIELSRWGNGREWSPLRNGPQNGLGEPGVSLSPIPLWWGEERPTWEKRKRKNRTEEGRKKRKRRLIELCGDRVWMSQWRAAIVLPRPQFGTVRSSFYCTVSSHNASFLLRSTPSLS